MISRHFVRVIAARASSHGYLTRNAATEAGMEKLAGDLPCRSCSSRKFTTSSRCLSTSQSDEGGAFGFGKYIQKLRWNQAEETASTLPEEESNRLREKTNQEKSDTDKEGIKKVEFGGRNQPSVDELLAEARADEAQRAAVKFEEKIELLKADMERAARKRLESDIEIQKRQIAFEKWKADLELEKQRQQAESVGKEGAPVTTSSAAEALGEHPILGPVVCDLGHKRVYLSSVERLGSLPVWDKQRFFRVDRVKKMAKEKEKSLHTGLPGIIGIYESNDGSLAIIDGQHRIGMLKELLAKKNNDKTGKDFDFNRILVEVYSQPEGAHADSYATDIFKEINKAQPANLIDLPGFVTAENLEIINAAVATIAGLYPKMFSSNTNCRKPHLNVDNVRNDIFLGQVIERNEIKNADDLVEWINARNREMAEYYSDEALKNNKALEKKTPAGALEKARTNSFYLGLDNSWYDQ